MHERIASCVFFRKIAGVIVLERDIEMPIPSPCILALRYPRLPLVHENPRQWCFTF